MAWVILLVAAVLEIGWAVGMKYTDGFWMKEKSQSVLKEERCC